MTTSPAPKLLNDPPPLAAAPLSQAEKAMLFDAATAAAQAGRASGGAEILMAFAAAYVAIRDRAEGII